MAQLSLSPGNYLVPFIGPVAVRLDAQPWFTAANVDVYTVSANRAGYTKNAGGSNQQFASFTTFQPSTTALPSSYIFVVKQTFTIDGTLFGTATTGGTKILPTFAGPAGEIVTDFQEQYFFDQTCTPSVSFSQGAGTLQFSFDDGASWVAMPVSIDANNGFYVRVQHPNNASFSATLTLTYQ